MPSIAVLGSCNVDLVTRLDRFPGPGETRPAHDFAIHPGGKGANQAVAAARLAGERTRVAMVGAIGGDPLGERSRASLAESGAELGDLERHDDAVTGTASIWVDDEGENAIAIAAGANDRVDAAFVDRHLDALLESDWILLQNEIPLVAAERLLKCVRDAGDDAPRVILDPAPPPELAALPAGLWLLTPNEHELAALLGRDLAGDEALAAAVRDLAKRSGAPRVLVKAGARGAWWWDADAGAEPRRVPGFEVEVVDTTAAGDTFNGALVAALAAGDDVDDAIRFAHAAAALSVGREGAQPSIPERGEVERFLGAREPAAGSGR